MWVSCSVLCCSGCCGHACLGARGASVAGSWCLGDRVCKLHQQMRCWEFVPGVRRIENPPLAIPVGRKLRCRWCFICRFAGTVTIIGWVLLGLVVWSSLCRRCLRWVRLRRGQRAGAALGSRSDCILRQFPNDLLPVGHAVCNGISCDLDQISFLQSYEHCRIEQDIQH